MTRSCRALVVSLAAVLAAPHALAQYQGIAGPASITHGQFGRLACAVPDATGDGLPEVAVGANYQPHGPIILPVEGRGRVFVYSSATGAFVRAIYPPVFGDPREWAIAGVPDVSDDSRGDLAVGVPGQHAPGGAVHLYSVATGAYLRAIRPPAGAAGLSFGVSVAGTPDADGDARGDVLVGATLPVLTLLAGPTGRAFLMSGATGQAIRIFTPPNVMPDPAFGSRVLSIPDVTGDAKPEVLVSGWGSVHVYSPVTGARVYSIIGPPQPASLVAVQPTFGHAVASVPDVNADGVADIVVGNPSVNVDLGPMLPAFAPDAGAVYLYSGRTGQLLRTVLGPAVGGNHFGWSVAGLPDMNGDGRGEIVVGAPINFELGAGQGYGPGAAFILSGANGNRIRNLVSPSPQLGGRFGETVLALPDTTGNGHGEVFIAAPHEDKDGQVFRNLGRAYFVRQ